MNRLIASALSAAAMMSAVVVCPLPAAAQSTKGSDMRTLSGCVTSTSKRSFTLEDADQGQQYKLTGTDVREYVGKHVEILGAPSKRLVIVGGLYPSANVAAQAGAIDANKAAIAANSGPTANAQRPLVEFKVRSVRITPGDCPKE